MIIKFWGTRGSIPVPGKDTLLYGGNTTCLEIALDTDQVIVVDAGTGIRNLGRRLVAEGLRKDIRLLMTHTHWDHVAGFPFFAPIRHPQAKVFIYRFSGCIKDPAVVFDEANIGVFPLRFQDVEARIRYIDVADHDPIQIDHLIIEPVPLQHPQGGLGYRFREGDRTVVFLPDNALTENAGRGRTYGDYVRFCRGVHVLIHDAQYTPEELKQRAGWGHSDYLSVLRLALDARVKQLILFHHDPVRKDSDLTRIRDRCEEMARGAQSDLTIDVAREGAELVIP